MEPNGDIDWQMLLCCGPARIQDTHLWMDGHRSIRDLPHAQIPLPQSKHCLLPSFPSLHLLAELGTKGPSLSPVLNSLLDRASPVAHKGTSLLLGSRCWGTKRCSQSWFIPLNKCLLHPASPHPLSVPHCTGPWNLDLGGTLGFRFWLFSFLCLLWPAAFPGMS
jgi:hypothetical protein